MRTFRKGVLLFWLGIWAALAAAEQPENQSAAGAIALAAQGLAHIRAVGLHKACADFSARDGRWVNGDFYVFVIRHDGLVMAHGANRGFVGKSMYELKDASGKPFVQEMSMLASTKGQGWVQYLWPNPRTRKIEEKLTYVQAVPGQDSFIAVGYHQGQ